MTRPFAPEFPDAAAPVLPECGPTLARLQSVLDGDATTDGVDTDPHPAACPTCRERIRATRLLLAVLAEPAVFPTSPTFTDAILAGVRADRRTRDRRRVFAIAGGFAIAAAVLVAVWVMNRPSDPNPGSPPPPDIVKNDPGPSPAPAAVPEPPPLRINDELAKAGQAFQNSSRPLTEPAAAAPRVFAALTDTLLKPSATPNPGLEPARKSLAEIPVAAKAGLEPVTDSAQKALSRLLKDVGAIQPGPKPKS